MINRIFWNEKKIINSQKIGRERIFTLEDNSTINRNKLKTEKIKILCNSCDQEKYVYFYNDVYTRNYICFKCHTLGEKNPFYEKKHSKETIEKIVKNKLQEKKLNFEYSVIFCHRQFDFGNKEYKILLEVHGDYWHGNPSIYSDFNTIQKRTMEKDIIKKQIAEKYGYKIYYIWEQQINNNDFSIIDEIEKYIKELKNEI